MSDSGKFMTRLGRMFKRPSALDGAGTATAVAVQALHATTDDAGLPADEDFAAAFGFFEAAGEGHASGRSESSAATGWTSDDAGGAPYDLREPAEAADGLPASAAYVSYEADRTAADELAQAVRDRSEERQRFVDADGHGYSSLSPVENAGTGPAALVEPRGMMLRPWRRQSEALVQMQRGFSTLTDLMGAIRQNLETQNRRQEELVSHLSTLPKVLEMIPEANRMQTEALKVMQSQLGQNAEQQAKLGDILDRMATVGNLQTESIESMKDRVEALKEHDEAISFNLNAVGAAMAAVGKNSQTSAEVLGQMKDNLNTRDGELQNVLQRQASRFTTMLSVAVVLSVGAVVAVSVFGYLILTHTH